jgi:hypothetical protein
LMAGLTTEERAAVADRFFGRCVII